MSKFIDLLVDARVFLNKMVFGRNIRLRLIIIVVRNKIGKDLDSSPNDYNTHQFHSVSKPTSSKYVFIPEVSESGNLYYMQHGSSQLKKFDFTLKEIVENKLGFRDKNHIFTGKKSTNIFAIDPNNGEVFVD